MSLPEQPRPQAGQRPPDRETADRLVAAVEDALAGRQATAYRDDTPLPAVGTTPPTPQPGRPPMSQRATDASTLMLTAGAGGLMLGGGIALVLWSSGAADPVVVGLICTAPVALALALARLFRALAGAGDQHHHYEGPVHQQMTVSHTRWLGRTTNNH